MIYFINDYVDNVESRIEFVNLGPKLFVYGNGNNVALPTIYTGFSNMAFYDVTFKAAYTGYTYILHCENCNVFLSNCTFIHEESSNGYHYYTLEVWRSLVHFTNGLNIINNSTTSVRGSIRLGRNAWMRDGGESAAVTHFTGTFGVLYYLYEDSVLCLNSSTALSNSYTDTPCQCFDACGFSKVMCDSGDAFIPNSTSGVLSTGSTLGTDPAS